jgi:cytochrome oxidase Cu insertion factor (SCO1/SenC/PrrC family)
VMAHLLGHGHRVDRSVSRGAVLGPVLVALMLQACASGGHPADSPSTSSTPPGTLASSFSLTDQFGLRRQLSDFRGRVVLLTFIDSDCTTLCPLTAELMTRTEQVLGSEYSLQLLAVNANPQSVSVSDVHAWSVQHRMLQRWLFLTGSVAELRAVWGSYGIHVEVLHGDVEHTAAIFLIDPSGRIRAVFPIAAQRGGIDGEARSLAQTVRRVVPSGQG